MPGPTVHHPVFARALALASRHESLQIRRHRQELLADLSGHVIELGAGAGNNFPHYPETVAEVVAVEPEPYLRERAQAAAAGAAVPVTVIDGIADALPHEDHAFDAAVACLVLCTVPDQATALAELRRVLRPDGTLHYCEHIRSQHRAIALGQHAVDRLFWPHAFGGCHTARDTPAAITAAGFEIERQREISIHPLSAVCPPATIVLGRARRPSPAHAAR